MFEPSPDPKGIRTCSSRGPLFWLLSNQARIQRGRSRRFIRLTLRRFLFEPSLDRKGIKTSGQIAQCGPQRLEQSPDPKGINTGSSQYHPPSNHSNQAPIQRGLRRHRTSELASVLFEPRSDPKGIKTHCMPGLRLTKQFEPSPDPNGIKIAVPPGPARASTVRTTPRSKGD